MAARKTPAHRWLRGIASAALLPAVATAAAASPAAAARQPPPAISAHHPPGYKIVSSGLVNAPPGAFDSGAFATCPAGTVVWGGGVAFSGPASLALSVNTSSPNGSGGWAARVNNTGTTTAQFGVDAICADKPSGYKIVSREVANPSATQSHATATCPATDVLLGGGALSTADQVAAVLTSAWPRSSAKFTGYLDNGTASAANLVAYAICGHKPAGYKIVSSSGPVSAGGALLDGIGCPAGTSALEGGAKVPDHVPAVQIETSSDQGAFGWVIVVDDTGQSADQADGYAICAS